jgi:hypothetical protein
MPEIPKTTLAPDKETQFQTDYKSWSDSSGMNPNPDAPEHFYDYRGAWQSGSMPTKKGGHWPDTYKLPGHPTFSVESKYYQPGMKAGYWEGDTYMPIGPGTNDDTSQNYLLSRQIAHEYNSPGVQNYLSSPQIDRGPVDTRLGPETNARPNEQMFAKPPTVPIDQIPTAQGEKGGLETPYLDPPMAAASGFGFGGKMALDTGMKLMPALGKALVQGIVGGISDYPVGALTEEVVEPQHPVLAIPFNMLVGAVSWTAVDKAIGKGVEKGLEELGGAVKKTPELVNSLVQDMKMRLQDTSGGGNIWKDLKTFTPSYTAEDFEISPEKMSQLKTGVLAFKVGNEVIQAKIGSKINGQVIYNHADLGIAKGIDFDTANPGFLDKSGIFVPQFPQESVLKSVVNTLNEEFGNLKTKLKDQGGGGQLIGPKKSLQEAYSELKSKLGYSSVPIADLRDRMGISQQEIDSLLRSEGKKGNISLSVGDWSLSPEHVRSGKVQIGDYRYLLARLNEPTEEAITPPIVQTALKKEENPVLQDLQTKTPNPVQEKLAGAMKTAVPLTNETIRADLTGSAETLPQYLGSINKDYLDTPDKIKGLINLNTQQFKAQFTEARRGVRTWEETEQAAKQYTLTDLLGRDVGQAYNAEQIQNARHLVVSSAENLQSMREAIRVGTATEEDKFKFMQAFSLHYAILEQAEGIASEAGRALNIFRKVTGPGGAGQARQMREMMKQMPASPEELADALSFMDNPIQVNKLVKGAMRATLKDMFLEAWINGLLWSPITQMANIGGNTAFANMQIPERFLASIWSKIFRDDAISMREPLQMLYGMFEGFKDGLVAGAKSFKSGLPPDATSKMETARYRAITAGNVRQLPLIQKLSPNSLQEGGFPARAVNLLGEVVRMPGRALMAEDQVFKSVGYRIELRAQAARIVSQEKLSGNDFETRVSQILSDPEKYAPSAHLAAINAASYLTFTNQLTSAMGRALSSPSPTGNPIGDIIIKTIAPFVKTPADIFKAGVERTPFAFLSKRILDDIKAGGARRDLALGRISFGSMLMGVTAIAAANGLITGAGPSDPKLQANLRRQGWQPFSFHIGNNYVQFNRMEPVGTVMGYAAAFTELASLAGEELAPEIEDLASAIVKSISKNVTSKTFMQGISSSIEAMNDPDRYGSKYIQNYAASMVPNVSSAVERAMDPEQSAVYGMMDAIKAKIPFLSRDLPPRRDLWGDVVTTQIGKGDRSWLEVAYSLVSPIYISKGKDSPIDKELTRMKFGVSMPTRRQTIIGTPLELQPKMLDDLIVMMNKDPFQQGKDLKDVLNEFVKSPDYKLMPDDMKQDKINTIISKAKNVGKIRLIEKYPILIQLAQAWEQRIAGEGITIAGGQ